MNTIQKLCDIIRQTAWDIHVYLGHGHLERIYQNALVSRLEKIGVFVEKEAAITVYDEDKTILGTLFADLLIDGCMIVEVKACKMLVPEHTAQLLGYLKATGIEHGLLINFGSAKFEIRKYIWSHPEGAARLG